MDNLPENQSPKPKTKAVHPLNRPTPTPPPPSKTPPPLAPVVDMPQSKTIMVFVLFGINVLVFLVDNLLAFLYSGEFGFGPLTYFGAKANDAILAGELWRFVTPVFLHAGLLHLGFNNYFLITRGRRVERHYGSLRFVILYFLAGISGAFFSFAFSSSMSIGASGALFGLIGALIPFLYSNKQIFMDVNAEIKGAAFTIVINLLSGMAPGIDNWGHFGGLVGGLLVGWILSPKFRVSAIEPGRVTIKDFASRSRAFLLTGMFAGGLLFVIAATMFMKGV